MQPPLVVQSVAAAEPQPLELPTDEARADGAVKKGPLRLNGSPSSECASAPWVGPSPIGRGWTDGSDGLPLRMQTKWPTSTPRSCPSALRSPLLGHGKRARHHNDVPPSTWRGAVVEGVEPGGYMTGSWHALQLILLWGLYGCV